MYRYAKIDTSMIPLGTRIHVRAPRNSVKGVEKREERDEGDAADYPARDEKAVDEPVPMGRKARPEEMERPEHILPREENLKKYEDGDDEGGLRKPEQESLDGHAQGQAEAEANDCYDKGEEKAVVREDHGEKDHARVQLDPRIDPREEAALVFFLEEEMHRLFAPSAALHIFLLREAFPVVTGRKSAHDARHEKNEEKEVPLVCVDKGGVDLPPVLMGDFLHDRFIDSLPLRP